VLLGACAAHVPLAPDGKWHAVYAVQVPETEAHFAVVNVPARRTGCKRSREPMTTQLRLLLVESFQSLDQLPDRIEDVPPRADMVPVRLADSGPYDLTLPGSTRVLKIDSGKQLLARSYDHCAALSLRRLRR
jgi:hypothetical protein